MKNFRIISLMTALVFLFTLIPVSLTADVYVGDDSTEVAATANISDFEITEDGHLTQYNGTASEVVIPDGVITIGGNAFSDNTFINSVIIPEGVIAIEGSAFMGCSKLANVTFPNSLSDIHAGIFRDCSSLKYISLPEGIRTIGAETFYNCSSLTSITLPSTLEVIDAATFYGCPIEIVYFRGSEEQYQSIDIHMENDSLLAAKVIYEESADGGETEVSRFSYEELYSAICSNDTVRIAEMLQTDAAKLELPMLENICNLDNLAQIMCFSGCGNPEQIEMAICIQLLNEKNCGKDYFDNYFRNFNECFGNLFAVYSEQLSEVQQLIVDTMQGREFCDLYDAEKVFAHITFLKAFQNSAGYTQAKQIILENADCLEIDKTLYAQLSTANQNRVIMALLDYEFDDLDSFKDHFASLCHRYNYTGSTSGGGGASGGSGLAYTTALEYYADSHTINASVTNNSDETLTFELYLAEGSDVCYANYESFIAVDKFISSASEATTHTWYIDEYLPGYPSGPYTVFLKEMNSDTYEAMTFEYTAPESTSPEISEIYFNTNFESYVKSIDGGIYNFIQLNIDNLCETDLKFDVYIVQDGYSITDGSYAFRDTLVCASGSSHSYEISVTEILTDYPSGVYGVHIVESTTGRIDSYNFEHQSEAATNDVLSRINSAASAEELYEIIQENAEYLGVELWKLEKLSSQNKNEMLNKLIGSYEAIESFKANYDYLYEYYISNEEDDSSNNRPSSGGGGGSSEEENPDGPYVEIANVKTLPGKTVMVDLMLKNNTGFANLGIEIGYDTSVMTLTSVETTEIPEISFQPSETYSTPYIMLWHSTNNCDFNGILATLTFEVESDAPSGIYPITVDFDKGVDGNYTDGTNVNYDENEASINLSYKHGMLEIIDHIPGDITGDEEVNYTDAFRLLKYLARWNVEVSQNALDVNCDGIVDNRDATRLLRWLDGWDVEIY